MGYVLSKFKNHSNHIQRSINLFEKSHNPAMWYLPYLKLKANPFDAISKSKAVI